MERDHSYRRVATACRFLYQPTIGGFFFGIPVVCSRISQQPLNSHTPVYRRLFFFISVPQRATCFGAVNLIVLTAKTPRLPLCRRLLFD